MHPRAVGCVLCHGAPPAVRETGLKAVGAQGQQGMAQALSAQGFAPVLGPPRAGEQQRVLKPPFSTNRGRAGARWCVPERSVGVAGPYSASKSHLEQRHGPSAQGRGFKSWSRGAMSISTRSGRCVLSLDRGGGSWRSPCSAVSCPLPLTSLIHLWKHNNTDTQQMSPVLPGWLGNATSHMTAAIDQRAPHCVTNDGGRLPLRFRSPGHGLAQSVKGAPSCCCSGGIRIFTLEKLQPSLLPPISVVTTQTELPIVLARVSGVSASITSAHLLSTKHAPTEAGNKPSPALRPGTWELWEDVPQRWYVGDVGHVLGRALAVVADA